MANYSRYISDDVKKAMEENKPFAQYKKAILGRVTVRTLDPLTGDETEYVLDGEGDAAIISLWSQFEKAYFDRANKVHLDRGTIIVYKASEAAENIPVNMISDEELEKALTGKFFAVKSLLDKFTSPVPVERMLALAEKLDRPVGTVNAIKAKLSELQAEEYSEK